RILHQHTHRKVIPSGSSPSGAPHAGLPAVRSRLRRLVPPLPVAPRLLLAVAGILAYGLLVSLIFRRLAVPMTDRGEGITVLNGVVLGVLMVFRNNAAYDRWWEGRKLWGQLVNDTRNLCLAARSLAAPEAEEARELGRALIGFAHALRLHLRGGGT